MTHEEHEAVASADGNEADDNRLTRRQALGTIARVGAAALPLVHATTASALQAPSPPTNLRIVTNPTGGRPVITPSDLRFAGFIRLPTFSELWYTRSRLAMRIVGGEVRCFSFDNDYSIYEYAVTEPPNRDLMSAPIATLRRRWGQVMEGYAKTGGSNYYPGGLHWDAGRNALWWTYGEGYVPTGHDPTVGATILNDSNGTFRSFGPWRTEWTSQLTRGAITTIPAAFASAYTSGKRSGISAFQASGAGTSPFGAALGAIDLPNPETTPPDVPNSTHWTIGTHGLILHDISHRQARDTNYKTCGWNVQYDCRQGTPLTQGIPMFGGTDPAAGADDSMTTVVWIDLPDKHGVLFLGQLVTTPIGYRAPGDPDGHVHMWYGAPFRNDGTPPATCCHGQDDPWWGATGPGSHVRVPMGWIYNPDDFVATARKTANLWSRVPASTFQMRSLVPEMLTRYEAHCFAGSVFDAASRKLYVLAPKHDFKTVPPHGRGVIMVFDIA